MATTTLSALVQLVSQQIDDWLSFDTTTVSTGTTAAITASTLANYDDASSDYYVDRWLYFTEGTNISKERKVKDYLSSSQTVKLRGVALAAAGATQPTVELHRFRRANKVLAIRRAIEEVFPLLYKPMDDMTLITNNIPINASFQDWSSSTALRYWTATNATQARTSFGSGTVRGASGLYSAQVSASAANGYIVLSSNTQPSLLDMMGKSISCYVWAYPQTADDPTIVIYTLQADGTAQTLTSTTACPAGAWTLIEFEDQSLNDDLVTIQIRLKVETNGQYCYFSDLFVRDGVSRYDYQLPYDSFQTDGVISQVRYQTSGYSDIPAYDLQPRHWSEKLQYDIVEYNDLRWLRLKDTLPSGHRLWVKGYRRLEDPSADTDTITLDGRRLNLLVFYALHKLYEMERGMASSEDKEWLSNESNYWLAKFKMSLPGLMMTPISGTQRI